MKGAKSLGILNRLGDEDISQNKHEVSIDLIDFNEKNFYNQGDIIEDIIELSESIEEVGLLHNVVVKPTDSGRYVLISGEKRTRAFKFLFDKTNDQKWKLIPCKVLYDLNNEADEEVALIKANRDVRERSDSVKAMEVGRLEVLYEGKKAAGEKVGAIRKRIAKDLGISETQVQRYKSINALIPEFKELLDSGEVNLSAVEYFTGFEPDVQKAIRDELKSSVVEIIEGENVEVHEITHKEDDPQVNAQKNKKSVVNSKHIEDIKLDVLVSQHVKKAYNAVKALDLKINELVHSGKNISLENDELITEMIKVLKNKKFLM